MSDMEQQQQQQQQQQEEEGARKKGGSWLNTVAGVTGNVLEWYDFALFGYFSDIIARVFFPPDTTEDNLVRSFAIFGGAFIMRPVGGILIGYVGDKYGRKVALTHSLMLMAIPTFCMGLLPTYQRVGSWATVLLVICRLLQGVSVGGQLPASLVYTVERHPKERWGFYGSLSMVAANTGGLLGNLMGALLRTILTEEELLSYGWRIPFYSGIIIAFVAVYLKYYGEEVPASELNKEDHNPLSMAFARGNRLPVLSVAMTSVLWAGGIYVSFVWMAIYMDSLLYPPVPSAFWVNCVADFLGVTIMLPMFGIASDRYGRIPLMTIAAVGLFVWGPVTVFVIGSVRNPYISCIVQTILGIFMAMFGGPLCSWLVETFDVQVRLTSASVGYDIAHAVAAGFSPLFATLLFRDMGEYSPALLYVLFAICALTGMYMLYCCGYQRNDDNDTATTSDVNDQQIANMAAASASDTTNDVNVELPAVT